MPKSTFGRSEGRLLKFWGMLLGKRFLIIFKARKNQPRIEKMRPKIEKRPPRHFFNQFFLDMKLIARALVGYSTLFLTWIAAISIIRFKNI